MTTGSPPIPQGEALVVCGGANRKPGDRYLDPAQVHAVMVVTEDGVVPCPWFDRHDPRTVAALLPDPAGTQVVYATEAEVLRLDLAQGAAQQFDVPDLGDVHELAWGRQGVLVANTERDEIVEISWPDGALSARHALEHFRHRAAIPDPRSVSETFHANQALVDGAGHLLVVAHHVAGYRRFSNAKRRVVRHGHGGILDLDAGTAQDLALHGPHSLRPWGAGWMIADSGRHELLTMNAAWEVEQRIPLTGWARGLATSPDEQLAYVGISATTVRYARRGDRAKTGVEVVELGGGGRWFVPLPQMEKVMWILRCSASLAERLATFSAPEVTVRR